MHITRASAIHLPHITHNTATSKGSNSVRVSSLDRSEYKLYKKSQFRIYFPHFSIAKMLENRMICRNMVVWHVYIPHCTQQAYYKHYGKNIKNLSIWKSVCILEAFETVLVIYVKYHLRVPSLWRREQAEWSVYWYVRMHIKVRVVLIIPLSIAVCSARATVLLPPSSIRQRGILDMVSQL